jgi:hypothetical protein
VKRPLTFEDGVGTGLGAAALLALLWLANQISVYSDMYRELGNARLPTLTRMVLGPVWHFGVPGAAFALALFALFMRIRHGTLLVALLTIGLVVVTYLGLFAPLTQLAGNISP